MYNLNHTGRSWLPAKLDKLLGREIRAKICMPPSLPHVACRGMPPGRSGLVPYSSSTVRAPASPSPTRPSLPSASTLPMHTRPPQFWNGLHGPLNN